MTIAIVLMVVAAALLAMALAMQRRTATAARMTPAIVDRINGLLPQTQCGRCTFAGCKPYATALARGEADINQCPPGGDHTAMALARLLGREAKTVDPRFGPVTAKPLIAWIDEPACIGCTKCIQACPVDAIVGASKFMHTVITAQCTGCELCVAPCPVDCIEMRPAAPQGQSRIEFPLPLAS